MPTTEIVDGTNDLELCCTKAAMKDTVGTQCHKYFGRMSQNVLRVSRSDKHVAEILCLDDMEQHEQAEKQSGSPGGVCLKFEATQLSKTKCTKSCCTSKAKTARVTFGGLLYWLIGSLLGPTPLGCGTRQWFGVIGVKEHIQLRTAIAGQGIFVELLRTSPP